MKMSVRPFFFAVIYVVGITLRVPKNYLGDIFLRILLVFWASAGKRK